METGLTAQPMVMAQPMAPMSIIELAITKGTDPDSLAKLVDLQERIRKAEAEKAFNEAIQAFQSECPPIPHDCEGYKGEYNYASLPRIIETIKPHLRSHRLSYSFDSETNGQTMLIKCTIHHVDGHSRTSQTQMAIQGTKMMNSPQMSASALTYGRRHTLCAALGLVTADSDDDGRNAEPRPRPDARGDAPQQTPRDQRVTVDEMKELTALWTKARGGSFPESEHKAKFAEWAVAATQGAIILEDARRQSKWTRDLWEQCMDRLESEEVPF